MRRKSDRIRPPNGPRSAPGAPILERPAPSREPRRVLWVYCEGERTEREWLDFLNRRATLLSLQIVAADDHGVPATLVKLAGGRRKGTPRDETWVCFDRDEHDIAGPIEDCRQAGIGLIFSNACFELWPLLHLEDRTRHTERHLLQARLHQVHPHYHHDRGARVDWPMLQPHEHQAVERAISLARRASDAGDLRGNPTTTAWLFHQRCSQPELERVAGDGMAHPVLGPVLRYPVLAPLLDSLAEPLRTSLKRAWQATASRS